MAYEKQTWVDNETIVDAARMEHIEAGIVAAEKLAEEKITNPAKGAVGQILEVETVDENGKPLSYKTVEKPTTGDTLPEVTEADNGKHLVVEGGAWVAKEVEATGGSERIVILEEQTVEGFDYQSALGVYFRALTPSPCVLELGKEYTVEWDGTEYTGTTFVFNNGESDLVAIGNTLLAGGEDTGVPFAVAYNSETDYLNMFAMTTENSHTLAIYQDVSNELPEVSAEDNGKFLQVVNGKWAAVAITNGNEVAY